MHTTEEKPSGRNHTEASYYSTAALGSKTTKISWVLPPRGTHSYWVHVSQLITQKAVGQLY